MMLRVTTLSQQIFISSFAGCSKGSLHLTKSHLTHLCTRQSLTLMSISSSLHMPTSVLLEANTKTFVDSVMQTVSSAKGTHGKQIKFNLPTKTHSQLASPNWKQIVWVVDRTLLATKCKIHLEIHREKKASSREEKRRTKVLSAHFDGVVVIVVVVVVVVAVQR